jgi:hypothetical protein
LDGERPPVRCENVTSVRRDAVDGSSVPGLCAVFTHRSDLARHRAPDRRAALFQGVRSVLLVPLVPTPSRATDRRQSATPDRQNSQAAVFPDGESSDPEPSFGRALVETPARHMCRHTDGVFRRARCIRHRASGRTTRNGSGSVVEHRVHSLRPVHGGRPRAHLCIDLTGQDAQIPALLKEPATHPDSSSIRAPL